MHGRERQSKQQTWPDCHSGISPVYTALHATALCPCMLQLYAPACYSPMPLHATALCPCPLSTVPEGSSHVPMYMQATPICMQATALSHQATAQSPGHAGRCAGWWNSCPRAHLDKLDRVSEAEALPPAPAPPVAAQGMLLPATAGCKGPGGGCCCCYCCSCGCCCDCALAVVVSAARRRAARRRWKTAGTHTTHTTQVLWCSGTHRCLSAVAHTGAEVQGSAHTTLPPTATSRAVWPCAMWWLTVFGVTVCLIADQGVLYY